MSDKGENNENVFFDMVCFARAEIEESTAIDNDHAIVWAWDEIQRLRAQLAGYILTHKADYELIAALESKLKQAE